MPAFGIPHQSCGNCSKSMFSFYHLYAIQTSVSGMRAYDQAATNYHSDAAFYTTSFSLCLPIFRNAIPHLILSLPVCLLSQMQQLTGSVFTKSPTMNEGRRARNRKIILFSRARRSVRPCAAPTLLYYLSSCLMEPVAPASRLALRCSACCTLVAKS